jgi:hypothetical protein
MRFMPPRHPNGESLCRALLCASREGCAKKSPSSAVSAQRVSGNRVINGLGSTPETLPQGRIKPCHFPLSRPCGAAYWCSGLQPLGLSPQPAPRWRRGANLPHPPNPSYRAKTSRAPNSAAAVKPMPTPMMSRAMGAVWRVVAVRWKPPMQTQPMRRAGAVVAMA